VGLKRQAIAIINHKDKPMISGRSRYYSAAFVAAGSCFAALMSGCSSDKKEDTASTATPGASSPAPASKPFVVAYNQWIGYVAFFAALDKGYFKDAGLDVQTKEFPGPADSVPVLMNGQIDCSMTTVDTVILLADKAKSNPISMAYIIDTSNGADGVIAQKEIKTVADLRGKSVAATPGQCNELLLLKALEKAGMTEKDVKIVTMDADKGGAAVIAHQIPAAVTWEPSLTKAASAGGHVIFSSKDAPNILMDAITFTKSTLDTRGDDVRKFLDAYGKGEAFVKEHPDEAAQIASKHFGTTPAESAAMLGKVLLYSPAENLTLVGTPDKTGTALASAKEIGDFFVAQKQLATVPDLSKLYTTDYLPKP